MMSRVRMAGVSAVIGLLSAGVFLLCFAVTALPAIAIVEDDNAFVTYGALGVAAVVAIFTSGFTHRRLTRWAQRRFGNDAGS